MVLSSFNENEKKSFNYRQVVTHVTLVDERDGAVSDGAAGKLLALA